MTTSAPSPATPSAPPIQRPQLRFEPTRLPDVILVVPPRFGDERGYFCETYHRGKFDEGGIGVEFVQDNQSFSRPAGTLRGLHYQLPPRAQDKLVRCLKGRILDVAVDIRRGSPTFGQHVAVELTADGGEQLFVPKGFAHGFATLEPECVVAYKCSDAYSPQHERGVAWDDPALEIDWQVDAASCLLSAKDRDNPVLAEQPDLFP